jgi:acetyl esterase/lipase
VLSLLLSLKEQDEQMPGGAVLLCPALTPPQDRPASAAGSLWTEEQQARFGEYYLAGHPHDDPIVAPLHADLTGLPPMHIQAATGDELLVDARRIAEHSGRHGVEVALELFPIATHVFHLFWPFLPEASDAVTKAGAFAARDRGARSGTVPLRT